jgi:hypothetical protein
MTQPTDLARGERSLVGAEAFEGDRRVRSIRGRGAIHWRPVKSLVISRNEPKPAERAIVSYCISPEVPGRQLKGAQRYRRRVLQLQKAVEGFPEPTGYLAIPDRPAEAHNGQVDTPEGDPQKGVDHTEREFSKEESRQHRAGDGSSETLPSEAQVSKALVAASRVFARDDSLLVRDIQSLEESPGNSTPSS